MIPTEEEYRAKIDFMVESIAKIFSYTHINNHGKRLMLYDIPDLKDIEIERNLSENLSYSNGEFNRMHMGIGYRYDGDLARREYRQQNGIKYNFSEWEILSN